MAQAARTVEELTREHKASLNVLDAAIERLQEIRQKAAVYQERLEGEIVPCAVVQTMLAHRPIIAWWSALAQSHVPELMAIHQEGRKDLQAQLDKQQQLLHKSKELQAQMANFQQQLENSDAQLRVALAQRNASSLQVAQTSRQREANHDAWLTQAMPEWSKDSNTQQTPMHRNYDEPRAWWEPLWLLHIVQPKRHGYIRQAMAFEEESGLSLFATAQGYPERQEAWLRANTELKSRTKRHEDLLLKHKYLQLAFDTHASDLNTVRQQLRPNSGAILTADAVQRGAIEKAMLFCGRNAIDTLGDLSLPWPQDGLVQRNAARNKAILDMLALMETTLSHWRNAQLVFHEGLRRLQKHDAFSLSGTSIDMQPLRSMMEHIQHGARTLHTWYDCLEQGRVLPPVSKEEMQVSVPRIAVPALDDALDHRPHGMGSLPVSGVHA